MDQYNTSNNNENLCVDELSFIPWSEDGAEYEALTKLLRDNNVADVTPPQTTTEQATPEHTVPSSTSVPTPHASTDNHPPTHVQIAHFGVSSSNVPTTLASPRLPLHSSKRSKRIFTESMERAHLFSATHDYNAAMTSTTYTTSTNLSTSSCSSNSSSSSCSSSSSSSSSVTSSTTEKDQPLSLFEIDTFSEVQVSPAEARFLQDMSRAEQEETRRRELAHNDNAQINALRNRIRDRIKTIIEFLTEQRRLPVQLRQTLSAQAFTQLRADVCEMHARNVFRDDRSVNETFMHQLLDVVLFYLSPETQTTEDHLMNLRFAYIYTQRLQFGAAQ